MTNTKFTLSLWQFENRSAKNGKSRLFSIFLHIGTLYYVALYMQSFAGESESPVSGAPLGTMLPPQAPIKVGKRWLAHVAPGPRRCCPKMPFFGQNRPKRVVCAGRRP